jgi:hypothetical protein
MSSLQDTPGDFIITVRREGHVRDTTELNGVTIADVRKALREAIAHTVEATEPVAAEGLGSSDANAQAAAFDGKPICVHFGGYLHEISTVAY